MLDALFGIGSLIISTIARVFRDTVKAIVLEAVREIVLPQAAAWGAAASPRHMAEVTGSDRRIEELERKRRRDGCLSARDAELLDDLCRRRDAAADAYRKARAGEVAAEAGASDYVSPILDPRHANILQYHTGMLVLEKRCPACGRPMALQHRTVPDPELGDFFWACTGFYDGHKCKPIAFRPGDAQLIHKAGIPEMEVDRHDIAIIGRQPVVQESVRRRVGEHLGEPDDQVLCPVHHRPMALQQKREHDGTVLDMYHLRCVHDGCSQVMKLKSVPQLAAYLRRSEGTGIV